MPTAFVTGAARGIGAAVARRLAADGYDLVLNHHTTPIEDTVAAVQATGRTATVLRADLADADAAQACARAAGPVDVFVANAGLYDRRTLSDMDPAAWRRTLAIDLDAPALMVQAMDLAPDARIAFIGSIAAHRGSRHGPHYAAAKAGLEGLARSLALELAPCRVNVVVPGYIDTAMIGADTPERRARRAAEVPLGRVGAPEDVAGAVSFLAGPDSAYVTGQCLHVNGGLLPSG